jgi:hypothetical protein
MPKVHFTKDFDWSPLPLNGRVTIAYKAGSVVVVTTPCANLAIAAGAAEHEPARKSNERR